MITPISTDRGDKIEFVEVRPGSRHDQILFALYVKRSTDSRISSSSVLDWNKHQDFVHSHPYRHWALVLLDEVPIGSLYFTQNNEVGLSLVSEKEGLYATILRHLVTQLDPLPAIPSVRRGTFVVNVAPSQEAILLALRECGAVLIQHTYEVLP